MSVEPQSLEYIEDPYFNPPEGGCFTPSLDEYYAEEDGCDLLEAELDLFDLRQLEFDDHPSSVLAGNEDESVNVEAEFFNAKRANAIVRSFFRKDFKRQVRVTYSDLTKPYLAKLPKENTFRKYLDISNGNGKRILTPAFRHGRSWFFASSTT
ncbi:PREDICTED: uncharacterized protein LOC108567153 [Nicrophorus vespilloides]|uniref:Uncharacterized protein LOC108567153 n=1 Tax=Nicrophorus vespilloides TaxID=110193 RepID=A0ABM1N7Z3_NICVS|nr:PREDICTED: uncharacterized protein LOC108567153 [Nicrophorus vespilloides]